jgi:hypothetical protein
MSKMRVQRGFEYLIELKFISPLFFHETNLKQQECATIQARGMLHQGGVHQQQHAQAHAPL